MRKGQFELPLVIGLLVFLSAVIVSSFVMNDEIKKTARFSSGGHAEIAAAEMKSEAYLNRMARELNYSSNIVALDLDSNEGGLSWDNNIPSSSQLRQEYWNKVETEFKTQNRMVRCQNPSVKAAGGDTNSPSTVLFAEFSSPWVVCSSSSVSANVSLPEKKIEVDNSNNRYVEIAEFASEVGEEAKKEMPNSISTGSGTDDGDSCPETKSTEKSEAKSSAKDDAVTGHKSIASDGLSATSSSQPVGTDATGSTSFSGTYTKVSSSSSGCDCTCDQRTNDGRCIIETCQGTNYSFGYDYDVDSITAGFSIKDKNKGIIGQNGQENSINFQFDYTNSSYN